MALVEFQGRRETREPVEMMARFRHHITTVTVMLKDITQHGAKIEGMSVPCTQTRLRGMV
jgi:hypothetical protein